MTTVPSTIWRMLAQRNASKKLPKGLDAAWDTALGWATRLKPRCHNFLEMAEQVADMKKQFADLADDRLRELAMEMRDIFRCGREDKDILRKAFAIVCEVAHRQLGERPYVVQIAGALAIEAGCIAEMATGEGKTLTATMPATIGGWRGKGCHVITVNDYLAKRDAEWMGRVYGFCGLSVSHIVQEMDPVSRRRAYLSDITYCTNKEVSADFLRDRLTLGRMHGLPSTLLAKIAEGQGSGTDRLVQRGLQYAIVDEADSVLIDEAVTPLIISGEAPNAEQVDAFKQAAELAKHLSKGRDYRVNQRFRDVDLTSAGKERLEKLAESLGGIWKGARRREELVTQAVTALEFYVCGKQYVIEENKVVIVDEFTGRLMPDREWRDGLHQAVSAKEEIEIQSPKDTYARISFQRFFRMYRKLSGMTGTANEAKPEFWQIYHLPVVVIPTNRPCIRRRLPDGIYGNEKAKWAAIVRDIGKIHRTGRPLLVGTRSVRASEHLSQLLFEAGLEHEVLNAIKHAEEAQIVSVAGQLGKITVATNMAGRGTDIKLRAGVKELGGLHVIATERHEAGRVDRQLFGRAGRQGDPGSAKAYVSLADELLVRYAPHLTASMQKRYGHGDNEITSKVVRRIVDMTQRRSERMSLRQRKGVLRTDDWLDEYLGFAGLEA